MIAGSLFTDADFQPPSLVQLWPPSSIAPVEHGLARTEPEPLEDRPKRSGATSRSSSWPIWRPALRSTVSRLIRSSLSPRWRSVKAGSRFP